MHLGRYTIFSNMTDWNPAEIIGTHPNTLAYSLYKHIITNDVWALQRKEFGYRDLGSTPLMVNFSGQPYIDCRASINSFIPKNLPNSTAERLINAYLEILKKNPHLHDKLELEVVFLQYGSQIFQKLRMNVLRIMTYLMMILEY